MKLISLVKWKQLPQIINYFAPMFLYFIQVLEASADSGDCSALSTLYTAMGGTSWSTKSNWLTGDCCANSWYGVSCSNSRVFLLSLYSNAVIGTIPPEIGSLASLQNLNLDDNSISGTIPTEIGSLTNLQYLDLGSNSISGTIPTDSVSLSILYYLGLGYNSISGTIPTIIGSLTSLTYLELGYNSLSGAIPDLDQSFGVACY